VKLEAGMYMKRGLEDYIDSIADSIGMKQTSSDAQDIGKYQVLELLQTFPLVAYFEHNALWRQDPIRRNLCQMRQLSIRRSVSRRG